MHQVQQRFHKDPAKIRLFLGGNRCLARGTKIWCPNGKLVRIEDLKPNDLVLAVDPDTRKTMPCPVEDVWANGVQDVRMFLSRGFDGTNRRTLDATNTHHVYTTRGLEEAGYLPDGALAYRPSDIYFVGSDCKFASVLGYILPFLSFEDRRPVIKCSSRFKKIIRRLIYTDKIDGYVKPMKDGHCAVYGELASFLSKHCQDPDKFYTYAQYNFNNDSIKKLLSGLIETKFTVKSSLPGVMCRGAREAAFITTAFRSIGVYLGPARPMGMGKVFRWINFRDPMDAKKAVRELKLPRIKKVLDAWALPLLRIRDTVNMKFLKQESYWRKLPDEEANIRETEVFDLKLAGENNLYVADGFVVGNSGKTEAGAVGAYWFMSGTHPFNKDIPVPNTGRILAESLDHFEADIVPKFKKWAPNFSKWKPIKGHQGKIAGYRLPNGSKFLVFTFNQEYGKLEGTNFYWCWANEPPPQSHVTASRRGLIDQGGYLWFTLTPLSEPYLYNDYYLPATTGQSDFITVHEASIHDNPWLDPQEVENFLSTLEPDERIAREEGKFRHLTGRVFKGFDPDIHVVEEADWPPQWPVTIGIDPHLRKDHHAVFLGKSRKGWYVVVDEIKHSGDLEEFAWAIIDRIRQRSYDVQAICADSLINQPDLSRRDIEPKRVLDDIFTEAGLPNIQIAKKKDTVTPFITEMKRLLKPIEWTQYKINGPSFYIMSRCMGTVRDFLNYVYREHNKPEIQGVSENPIKRWDDFLDSLKYAFLADPAFEHKNAESAFAAPHTDHLYGK